ncbi:MAG: polymer-forming cytoskeletal protein [Chloroflexota bacterium]
MRKVALFSITATALVLLLFVPATISAAQYDETLPIGETNEDLTFFDNKNVLIPEGAVVNGDVSSFRGHLTVNGVINGDLTVFGGTVLINGELLGDSVILGGELQYGASAVVEGDCVILGKSQRLSDNENICQEHFSFDPEEIVNTMGIDIINELPSPVNPEAPPDPPFNGEFVSEPEVSTGGFFASIFGTVFSALFMGFIAYIIASAVPSRLSNVREAITSRTVASGGVGFLTAIASSSLFLLTSPIWLIVFIALTLLFGLGLVLAILAGAFIIAVSLLGWTAIGSAVGRRLAVINRRSFKHNDPLAAAIGTGVLSIGLTLLGNMTPFISWMAIVTIFSVGLGGVVLTRLGKQTYPALTLDAGKVSQVLETLPKD